MNNHFKKILLIALLAIPIVKIQGQGFPISATNGPVNAIVLNTATGILYVGGWFTAVNASVTGSFVALNANDALPQNGWPTIDKGSIYAIISDGAGGWYIGGSFTSVGGVPRNRLAQINASKSVTEWNPNLNNIVSSLALDGNTLYAGGDFTTIGGIGRKYLAAIDINEGSVTGWNPNPNGSITDIIIQNNILYTAGSFTSITGISRNYIAAIDIISGIPTNWNPNPNASINTFGMSNNIVYVGGEFTTIGGISRNYIAAIDAISGTVTNWDPGTNESVDQLVIDNTTLYVGGEFNFIGGQSRKNIAAIDITSGNVTSWNPIISLNGFINTLASDGNNIYVGGNFTSVNSLTRNNLTSIDIHTGTITGWNPGLNNEVSLLAVIGTTVFTGGYFTTAGGETRNNIAAIDANTGNATSWNPNADAPIATLALEGNTVYAGGNFYTIGGQNRSGLAAIDMITGTVTAWNPNPSGSVKTIALNGNTLYAGGEFTSVGGQIRKNIAAIDITSGNATSWDPSPDGPLYPDVNCIAISGNTIYAGGYFTTISGVSRNRLAAIDANTGLAKDWDPGKDDFNVNNAVLALTIHNNNVYICGGFDQIDGQIRTSIAAVDMNNGTVTSFNPLGNSNIVRAIAVDETIIYAGGDFSYLGGQSRNSVAAFDSNTGNATSWNPNAQSSNSLVPMVYSLALDDSKVYIGGVFTSLSGTGGWPGYSSAYLARLDKSLNYQSINGFGPIPPQSLLSGSYTISGVYSSSGLPVTFTSSNLSVATVSGNVVSFLSGGSTVIKAWQPGGNGFGPSNPAYQILLINKYPQTIIGFDPVSAHSLSSAFYTISGVSASSGLPVMFSSSNHAVATVSGNVVNLLSIGLTSITAFQIGNSQYSSAKNIIQLLNVINDPSTSTSPGNNTGTGTNTSTTGINSSVNTDLFSDQWEVFPNPTDGKFNIRIDYSGLENERNPFQVNVINTLGEHITNLGLGEHTLSKGLYLLKRGKVSKKLLIE